MRLNKSSIIDFLKNSLVNQSIKVLFIRIFGVLLFFGLTLFLTNNFDPSLVGEYDFSRSLLIFLGALSVFGMHQSVIYYSGHLASINNLWYIKKVYYKMVLVVLLISITIYLGSLLLKTNFIGRFINISISITAEKTIIGLFFYGLTMLNIDVLRGIKKIYLSEIHRNIIRYVLFLIGILIIFFSENESLLVEVFLLNFAALSLISTLILLLIFSGKEFKRGIVDIGYKDIIKRSAPMAVSAASFLLMQSLDIMMLANFTNYELVAYYGSAVKLTMIIALVLASVNSVITPQIAELFSSEKMAVLKDRIIKGTRLIFIITFPMILVLAIMPTFILGFFGENYISAKNALWILLAGQAINSICGSVGVYLNMTGKQRPFQRILVSALILNVVLNYFLIPEFGMSGAAIATSTSMILWNIIAVIYVYRKDKIKVYLTIK
jgi:O-antigen/teichoic acid export membrane protein